MNGIYGALHALRIGSLLHKLAFFFKPLRTACTEALQQRRARRTAYIRPRKARRCSSADSRHPVRRECKEGCLVNFHIYMVRGVPRGHDSSVANASLNMPVCGELRQSPWPALELTGVHPDEPQPGNPLNQALEILEG